MRHQGILKPLFLKNPLIYFLFNKYVHYREIFYPVFHKEDLPVLQKETKHTPLHFLHLNNFHYKEKKGGGEINITYKKRE